MRDNTHSDAFSFGAYQDFFRPFVEQFELATASFDGRVRPGELYEQGEIHSPQHAIMRLNLEVWGLAQKRARAYADIPAKIAQCRSPADLTGQQVEFVQTALHQYTECAQHSAKLWQAALHMPTSTAGWWGSGVWDKLETHPADVPQTHDYVDVAVSPRGETGRDETKSVKAGQKSRKAA